jgi:hypothetical protein
MSEQETSDYPAQVRVHVWESLVSMMQVYAHAASLNGKEYVVTSDSNKVSVKHDASVLNISIHPETGEAHWSVKRPGCEESGEFRIDEHGALVFPAGPKDLDTAAIDWIALLDHTAPALHNENVRS